MSLGTTKNISEIKRKAVPILKRAGVLRSSVFGSIARGEAGEKSDVDFLVELPDYYTLLDLVGLQQELESVLGCSVDIVTRRSLYEPLRHYIERDEISIL